MNEEEFIKNIEGMNRNIDGLVLEIPIFWSIDEDENVLVDEESIREEFEEKLKNLLFLVEK